MDKERLLDEVLAAGGSGGWVLPPLSAEKGWFSRLSDFLGDLVGHWLDKVKLDSETNRWLIKAAFYGLGAVTILAVLVLVGRELYLLLWGRGREFSALSFPRGLPSEESRITERLQAALQGGRFGEAGRLRWKLFLLRSRAESSLTPREGLGRGMGLGEGVGSLDRLLFGPPESASPLFEGWDRRFSQLERGGDV